MKINLFELMRKPEIFRDDDPITALLKVMIGIFLVLPTIILIMIVRGIILMRHWTLATKNKDQHKVKGFVVTQNGNMIHTEYDDNCSCGRKEAPKSPMDFLSKVLK